MPTTVPKMVVEPTLSSKSDWCWQILVFWTVTGQERQKGVMLGGEGRTKDGRPRAQVNRCERTWAMDVVERCMVLQKLVAASS